MHRIQFHTVFHLSLLVMLSGCLVSKRSREGRLDKLYKTNAECLQIPNHDSVKVVLYSGCISCGNKSMWEPKNYYSPPFLIEPYFSILKKRYPKIKFLPSASEDSLNALGGNRYIRMSICGNRYSARRTNILEEYSFKEKTSVLERKWRYRKGEWKEFLK